MASLRVPKKHHKGLETFFRLPEESFQHFISDLKDKAMTLDTREVIAEAMSEIEGIPADQLHIITEAILSLSLAKATSDVDNEQFINELLEAIGENYELAPLFKDGGFDAVKMRLETFFGVSHLSVAAKARSIMYEYENVYYKSRVITDIRPIFSSEIESVDAALIIHNLRIHYHTGENHNDFYVALDSDDLQQLIDVLERAKSKAKKIKTMLDTSETPYFGG